MLVLGWHGGVRARETDDAPGGFSSHDGAAVVVRDGELVAAFEEERLSRVKHANFFPARAIRAALDEAGAALGDVDFIAVDIRRDTLQSYLTFEALADPTLPMATAEAWLGSLFSETFGQDVTHKIRFCPHHLAHLYGAFYPSGFERALVVSMDGEGDGLSGMAAIFDGQTHTLLREYSAAHSLGEFYTKVIALLGYRRFDEYKVMGLAPYGDADVYSPLLQQIYRLAPEGWVEIAPDHVKMATIGESEVLGHVRRKGQPFTDVHKHLAAALQRSLEQMAFHILRHVQAETGERTLCLSGGVAHNCTMNGLLLRSGSFDRIFVQPAAHDAGNALGAALAITQQEGVRLPHRRLRHLFLGTDTGTDDDIARILDAWRPFIAYERDPRIAERAAQRLADGAVIGWVQGRAEFGPRALGNRSILADPRPSENKRIINQMVKKREGYRPFAPSVHEHRVNDFFECPEGVADLSFMNFVVKVREEHRETLGAITHVDGTARVQTISAEQNPAYYELIAAFERHTGIPILLNTSFNNDAEPIVDSVEDAIACFLTTGIDELVIGHYHVRKHAPSGKHIALQALIPRLRPSKKLVRRCTPAIDGTHHVSYAVEPTVNDYFGGRTSDISASAFAILAATSARTLAEHFDALALGSDDRAAVTDEFFELWERRAIALRPRYPQATHQ